MSDAESPPPSLREARLAALLETPTLNHPLGDSLELLELALSALSSGDILLATPHTASAGWTSTSLAKVTAALGSRVLRTASVALASLLHNDLERTLIGTTPLRSLPEHPAEVARVESALTLVPHILRIAALPIAPGATLRPTSFFGRSGAEPAAVRPPVIQFYADAAEATLRLSLLGHRWDRGVCAEARWWLDRADSPPGALAADPFSAQLRETLWALTLFHLAMHPFEGPRKWTSVCAIWAFFGKTTRFAPFTVDRRVGSQRACRGAGASMVDVEGASEEGPGVAWRRGAALLDAEVVARLGEAPPIAGVAPRESRPLAPL